MADENRLEKRRLRRGRNRTDNREIEAVNMAEEARIFESEDVPFSGKIADVFTITGRGTFVLLEEFVGRPKPGQELEVVKDGEVIGTVKLSNLEQELRPHYGSLIALYFDGAPSIHLERGQILRIPPVVERPGYAGVDHFNERLSAFVPALGWTTVCGFIIAVLLWLTYAFTVIGIIHWPPVWLEPTWVQFSSSVSLLVIVLAAVWLTARNWLRRLVRT